MLADVRFALRSFVKAPAFTALVILTLALGVGANTAIFSVVDGVLLRPLPYPDPDTLLRVRRGSSYPDMRDWLHYTRSFDAIGGFRSHPFDYSDGPEAERVDGALATGDLLRVLGARPLLGRLISPDDDRAGTERIVVISEDFWRTRLGGDPGVLETRVTLNGTPYTVVGVLPSSFELPALRAAVIAPFAPDAGREADARGAHTLRAILRLKPGTTPAQAQQELDALAVRLEQSYPETNSDMRFVLQRLDDSMVTQIRPALRLLVGTVAFVLLIACVNVANMLIARAAGRREEMAVRAALGASRTRLLRQTLTESVLLAIAGAAAGLVTAYWLIATVVALAPQNVPRLDSVSIDARVLAFTALVALATGLAFGVVPALGSTSPRLATISSRRTTGASDAARSALLVVEVALALVLVVGTGLLLRSFAAVTRQPLGFDPSALVTANITLTADRYLEVATRTRVFSEFESAVRALPGVRDVALTTDLPIGGNPIFHNLAFEGRSMAAGTEPEVYYRGVNMTYFDALGIPLLKGRRFIQDDRATSPAVAIVNDAFVRTYYPGEDPLGRRIRWVSGDGEWITIVGVVADVRGLSLDQSEVPAVHVPYTQERMPWRRWLDVAVRADGNASAVIAAMRRELARLDRLVPLTKAQTMEEVLAQSVADRRFNLLLLGGFALLAIVLAAAGTYGVMGCMVAQRTREIGVRMALGATARHILLVVAGKGLLLAAAGVVLGAFASFWLSRLISDLLFEVSPGDVRTFAAAAVLLLAAAFVASYVPARRAARIDPLIALRSE
jgi:putative ABC transport system permease protein